MSLGKISNKGQMNEPNVVPFIECMQVDLRINQKPVIRESLGGELAIIFKEHTERVAFVTAWENLEFAEVARAIEIAKGAGVDPVGLMASNP